MPGHFQQGQAAQHSPTDSFKETIETITCKITIKQFAIGKWPSRNS
jgi:hypothetical protein